MTHQKLSEEIIKLINEFKLDKFLKNSLLQNIFFIHNRLFIFKELTELKKDKKWKIWKKLLIENNIGDPIRYFLYPLKWWQQDQTSYFLKKFLNHKNNCILKNKKGD